MSGQKEQTEMSPGLIRALLQGIIAKEIKEYDYRLAAKEKNPRVEKLKAEQANYRKLLKLVKAKRIGVIS